MATGDRIYIADKETLDKVKVNTDGILAAVQDAEGIFKNIKRYGVKINKLDSNPATRITYLYDAVGLTPAGMNYVAGTFDYGSWADLWFVKNNYPVMVKYDGTEDYKLLPTNYEFKEDGVTASDVANTAYAGNAMAAMPLVWISQYEIGNYEYIILCDKQYDSTYKAYAHQRANGTIQDKIYLSMFKGSYDGTRLRSISGQQPMYSQTAAAEITRATANGAQWYIKTYSQRNLLQCLLTVMSKTDNGQTAYGNGNLNYNAALTPTMGVMATGSLNTNGQFMGYNDNIRQVKVFHQEAPWADQWDRLAGMLNVNGKIKVKMTRPYNLIGTGFIDTGLTPIGTSGGYIKDSKMTEYGRMPYNAAGSSSTYQSDGLWFNNGITAVALAGGSCAAGPLGGPWSVDLYGSAAVAGWSVGASLSCELPAA